MLRAWASINAMACSATERMFDVGALTTMTPLGRRVHVDVIEPDAGPPDHGERRARRQDVGGDLRRRADDQRGRADDRLEQLFGAEPLAHVDLVAGVGEQIQAALSAIFSVTSTRATAVVLPCSPRLVW